MPSIVLSQKFAYSESRHSTLISHVLKDDDLGPISSHLYAGISDDGQEAMESCTENDICSLH